MQHSVSLRCHASCAPIPIVGCPGSRKMKPLPPEALTSLRDDHYNDGWNNTVPNTLLPPPSPWSPSEPPDPFCFSTSKLVTHFTQTRYFILRLSSYTAQSCCCCCCSCHPSSCRKMLSSTGRLEGTQEEMPHLVDPWSGRP